MIDTHCHLLHGLDDGPRTLGDAVELARRLVADGVAHVLCTPHYTGMFPTDHDQAIRSLEELRTELVRFRIELGTTLAAEVGSGFAVSAPPEELRRRSVAARFLLVEILPDAVPATLDTVAARLAELGLTPVYAHPERARTVQRDPRILDDVRRAGALVQVVAPSLLGRWGKGARSASWFLVDHGLVDLVGSDAHGVTRRRPHLREIERDIASRVGAGVAIRLTRENPEQVLAGMSPG